MTLSLDTSALNQLFTDTRTHNTWRDEPVTPALLRQLYDLAKWGPTSMNCCPLRVKFVVGTEARSRLLPLMSEGNRAKTAAAPVIAILGRDVDFHQHLPLLAPHMAGMRERFADQPAQREAMSQLNGGLQAGFDAAAVDAAFWAGTAVKSMIVCNLGHGDPAGLRPRAPRLDFDAACEIL